MIAIIDYGMGNLRSVSKAFEAVGHEAVVTRDPHVIGNASHVVLPGVGAFGDCMANVERYGLAEPIRTAIQSGKPFLGICLGLQLLFEESEEFGTHKGLGIIPGTVRRFAADLELKVPHMGWNNVTHRVTIDQKLWIVDMNIMMGNKGWSMAIVGLAVLAVGGCSGLKVTTKASSDLARYQIRTIALVPFTILATPQVRDVVDQAFSMPSGARRSDMAIAVPPNTDQLVRETVTVPMSAGDTITQLLWSRLKTRQGVTVLAPSEAAKVLASQSTTQSPAGQLPAVVVAKQLKVDASLIGQVLMYQERVGGRFGASPPATVGFEAKVIAADGQVLWVGNYYERQRPMIEDVMGFIQRHGMFVTAEELATYGVEHLLLEFPFGTGEER